ncbi:hypothetical protein pb186bvf_000760 [Paramecium bursaria]
MVSLSGSEEFIKTGSNFHFFYYFVKNYNIFLLSQLWNK